MVLIKTYLNFYDLCTYLKDWWNCLLPCTFYYTWIRSHLSNFSSFFIISKLNSYFTYSVKESHLVNGLNNNIFESYYDLCTYLRLVKLSVVMYRSSRVPSYTWIRSHLSNYYHSGLMKHNEACMYVTVWSVEPCFKSNSSLPIYKS